MSKITTLFEDVFKALPFLKSTRFWSLVLLGATIWLKEEGLIQPEFMNFIKLVTVGHIGIRSIDRFAENL